MGPGAWKARKLAPAETGPVSAIIGTDVDKAPNNPARNKLGQSISEANLIGAIVSSGYPLQGIVADKLSGFAVTEEWGYIDRDTQERRSLDIHAFKRLSVDSEARPRLALLIECKRSIYPYVFFKNVVDREIPHFPKIAGLRPGDLFPLMDSGHKRTKGISGAAALGLAELAFILDGPPHCSAYTKALARGGKIALSGSGPFNTLVLPLVKACDHAVSLYEVVGRWPPLWPTLVFSVSVLDAPMLVVNSPGEASKPVLTPWVRVLRQEAHRDRHAISNYVYYVVDVVHVDFFDEFLCTHLMPFLDEFASRTQQQSAVLLGGGTVENLDNWRWDEIRPRHN